MLTATCELPHEALALAETFATVPCLEVEAERIAAHSTEWTMPCLWVRGTDLGAAEVSLDADPTVATVVETERFDGEAYYHVEWAAGVQDRIDAYLDKEASIIRATADADGWELEIRFAGRDQFEAFREHLDAQGHSFALRSLSESGSQRGSAGALTPDQREVLEAALAQGYFQVPREVTTRELADELDRSHQTVSELLRRGTENLVAATL